MSDETINVSLDSSKVKELMAVWGQKSPEALVKTLFDYVYRYYVDEKDELISKRLADGRLSEKAQKWRAKLEVKQVRDRERKLCPACDHRVKYDAIEDEYACSNCGWRGPNPTIEEK